MLKQSEAVEAINKAIGMGYKIYIPRNSELVQDKRYQVQHIAHDLRVTLTYGIMAIANDYRLESMYVQARHYLGN